MKQKEFYKLKAASERIAKSRGLSSDAEDIAQEVLLSRFLGKTQSIEQILSDYYRTEFGDTRTKLGASGRRGGVHVPISSVDIPHKESDSRLEGILNGIPPIDRALIILRFFWGLEYREAGWIFGRSEAWAFNKIESALGTIRAQYVNKEY